MGLIWKMLLFLFYFCMITFSPYICVTVNIIYEVSNSISHLIEVRLAILMHAKFFQKTGSSVQEEVETSYDAVAGITTITLRLRYKLCP